MTELKKQLFDILEVADPDNNLCGKYEKFMFTLIVLNICVTILSTVQEIHQPGRVFFYWFDLFSLTVFTAEYMAKLWVCRLDERYNSVILGRLRYMLTPVMLLDLTVIIPLYLPLVFGFDARFMLMFRMLRLAQFLRLTRFLHNFHRLARVLRNKKDDLIATFGVIFLLLIISSSLMYYAEYNAQPDKFSSIPAAMWWGIVTLTTIGYGDLYPVTSLGKLIGAFVAILGIGMVALPTGIIGSGFLEELASKKSKDRCPHCGRELDS